jgi:transposase
VELWASIEKPEGRIVDFLLDHGVVVYPINPKALDRARDRFRMSGAKSDPFDARVLAEFLRTDHPHLRPLMPSSDQAQELKLLTRDHQRLLRHQTRLLNQLRAALKEYYPRPLKVFGDLSTASALDFLEQYSRPEALTTEGWQQFAAAHRWSRSRASLAWELLGQSSIPVPAHVARAKSRMVRALVAQLRVVGATLGEYRAEIEAFFGSMPAAEVARSLPGGKSGVTVPGLWAELGDAAGRWESFQHLQGQAGAVLPVTKRSGNTSGVHFRFACNKRLRRAVNRLSFLSLRYSTWAPAYYRRQRRKGHTHQQSLRALGAKWLKIIFVMWRDQTPYNEERHLANIARQTMYQAA